MNVKNTKRYSDFEFPPYAFIPGHHPHPEKEGGHMLSLRLPFHSFDLINPRSCQTFLYAIDLMNFQYYWEAHVYLEELWNEQNRKGILADFFKCLIKICAAGVKFKMSQYDIAIQHLIRAQDLIINLEPLSMELPIDLVILNKSIANSTKQIKNSFNIKVEIKRSN